MFLALKSSSFRRISIQMNDCNDGLLVTRSRPQAVVQVDDVHVPKMQIFLPEHVSERMVELQVHVPLQDSGISEDHCGATRA